jgi:hypothetical protein
MKKIFIKYIPQYIVVSVENDWKFPRFLMVLSMIPQYIVVIIKLLCDNFFGKIFKKVLTNVIGNDIIKSWSMRMSMRLKNEWK